MKTSKLFFLFSLIFLNPNALFSQVSDAVEVDSVYIENYDSAEAATDAAVMVEAYDYVSEIGVYSMPDDELLKYSFKKGKPVFVVVNIQHSNPNDSLLAVREIEELQRNFKHLEADFLTVHDNSVLIFENHENYELRLDNYNDWYQLVIFWDGKKDSEIFQFESIIQSSEAYSPQLGVDENSSYVTDFSQKKEELLNFKNETINQKSTVVSKKYISNMFLAEVYYLKNEEHFFQANFKGVKRLTVKTNYKKFKNPVNEAEFDIDGNPTNLILQSDDSDGKKINLQFSYLSGALKKIVSTYPDEGVQRKEESEYFYQQGMMYEMRHEDSFSKYYLNENGFLLSNYYYFDQIRFFIIEDELTFKDKTLSYRDYGNLNDRDYTINSLENFFPVKVKLREDSFYEIKKLSQNEFQIESDYSTTKVLLNEKGKIAKVIMENIEMEGESTPMDLIFEYFYEYY